LCAPIYIYAFVTIRNGSNVSEFGYLFEGVYENRSFMARAIDAIEIAYAWLGFGKAAAAIAALAGFAVLNLAVLRDARYRWILLAINIPFTCLWALYFSYDRRNLALALPLWALTSGVGARVLLERYWNLPAWPLADRSLASPRAGVASRHGPAAVLVVAAMAMILVANRYFTEDRMHARQDAIELQILAREEPGPVAPMLSLMRQLGPALRIYSEWRWACVFHFNRSSENCRRIFPDQFFRAPVDSAIGNTTRPVLLIVLGSSLNGDRERRLREAGFVEQPPAENSGYRYFVRAPTG
jgi:hypothetical protein